MTTGKAKLRGNELLFAIVEQITRHSETFDQRVYHSRCGTRHCVAGWAQILGGCRVDWERTLNDAEKLLGLADADCRWLFATTRSLEEICGFAAAKAGGYVDGYDRDGYNRSGYNREGYARDGYNWYGFDRDGYNRRGYHSSNCDRDGGLWKYLWS